MTTDKKLRVLVVDDHKVVRAGVCAILSCNPLWQVCGEADNGVSAIEKVQELEPDLVILDISMPQMNGIQAASEIRRVAPATKDAVVTKRMAADSLTSTVERLFDERGAELQGDSVTSDVATS
jgi:DNA-binding NarL/FixJ family response regulator